MSDLSIGCKGSEIEVMRACKIFFGIAVVVVLMPFASTAQDDASMAMLSMEATTTARKEPKVTAVYGVSADDYLPRTESARKHLRPKVRSHASRPSFDLPDAFYFIGAPIFVLLFLRVLVIFLSGFEENRKEELRLSMQEMPDID